MGSLCQFLQNGIIKGRHLGVNLYIRMAQITSKIIIFPWLVQIYNQNHQSVRIMKLSTIFTIVASVVGHTTTVKFASEYFCIQSSTFQWNILIYIIKALKM